MSISLTEFIEKYSNIEPGTWNEEKVSVAGKNHKHQHLHSVKLYIITFS